LAVEKSTAVTVESRLPSVKQLVDELQCPLSGNGPAVILPVPKPSTRTVPALKRDHLKCAGVLESVGFDFQTP
jgi:hypothetical protein